jgi:molecular chaperone GrpE (heat shock protein)
MEAKYFKIIELPTEDILKLLSIFEQNSKVTQTEAGKKAAEEFKKELRKIHNECEAKLQESLTQPEKEIERLRDNLDEVQKEYDNARIEWEKKLEDTVQDITEKFQKQHSIIEAMSSPSNDLLTGKTNIS